MLKFLTDRRRLIVLAVALPAGVALVAHPTLAESLGVDVWNVAALRQQVRDLTAQHERLDAADADARRRIEVKEAVIGELLDGRATLPEVTARFLELDATRPVHLQVIRETFPGATDEEKMARNVIQYALFRVAPEKRDELSSRLDGELQQMLACAAHVE